MNVKSDNKYQLYQPQDRDECAYQNQAKANNDKLPTHEMTSIQAPINYVIKVNNHWCLMKCYK